jgi:broad specificity phosphatase PhoE
MKPRNIFILRHGQSEGNIDDSIYQTKPDYALDLTCDGEYQATRAGVSLAKLCGVEVSRTESCYDVATLRGKNRTGFYVSPYFRTRQTHHRIRRSFPDELVTFDKYDPRLREQEWGMFQPERGLTPYEDERDKFGRFFYRFRNGESGADVYDRVSDFIGSMFRDFEYDDFPENVVIVGHGFTNRVLFMRWFKEHPEQFEEYENPKNCDWYHLKLGSLKNGYLGKCKYEAVKGPERKWKAPYVYTDEPNKKS